MDLQHIVAAVGRVAYHQAAETARRAAPQTGLWPQTEDFDSTIVHTISALIWESSLADVEKMALVWQVYSDMPCYALLMGIKLSYAQLSPAAQHLFWEQARMLLAHGDDAVAEPLAYSLWCDFFEDDSTVEQAWAELVENNTTMTRLLQRVLIVSGPVPFHLKAQLYRRLLNDKTWHYYIFRSLLHSTFDVYGDLDRGKATVLLQRLVLRPDTEHLTTLQDALKGGHGSRHSSRTKRP